MSERMEMLADLAESRAMRDSSRAQRDARIRKLARDGLTPTEIQRRLRVAQTTVRRALSAAGIRPTLHQGRWPEP